MKLQQQMSAQLLQGANVAAYLLLFLAPFAPRWILVYHHVANLLPEFSSTLFYLVDIILILAVALWLIAHLLDTSRPVRLNPWFITVPLMVLMTWSGLSVLWATSKSISAELFVRLTGLLALYLLIRNDLRSWRVAGWILVVGMTVQAIIATAQFFTRGAVGLFFLGEMEALVTRPGNWVRGYGLSPNANILGGYLLLGLAATLALALNGPRRQNRLLLLSIFGIGMSGLISTFSRSAWLGMALGWGLAVVVIFLNPAARARWGLILVQFSLVGATVGIMYLAITPDFFVSRLIAPLDGRLSFDSPATEHPEMLNLLERAQETRLAWQLITTHFPLGVGGANFSLVSYLLNPNLSPNSIYLPVHNVLLLVTAELGPAGGFSWIFLAAAFAFALWQKRTALVEDPWLLGWSIATLALLVTGFFDFYLWGWQPGRLMLWLTLGLWAGAYTSEVKKIHQHPEALSNGHAKAS